MKTRTILAAVPVAALLALAACGDDEGSGDATGGDSAGFCELVKRYEEQTDELDNVFASETPDPAEVKDTVETGKEQLDALIAAAPAEIAEYAATVGSAYDQFVEALASVDYDLAALQNDPDALEKAVGLNADEVLVASDEIDNYTEQECGITLGS